MREYSIGKRLVEGYLHQPYSWFLNRHSADLGKTILSEVSTVIIGACSLDDAHGAKHGRAGAADLAHHRRPDAGAQRRRGAGAGLCRHLRRHERLAQRLGQRALRPIKNALPP